MTEKQQKALDKMKAHGQQDALRFWEELTEENRERFAEQILKTDFAGLTSYDAGSIGHQGVIRPIRALTVDEIRAREDELLNIGLSSLKAGEAAAVLLAGGMGTRLGSDGPKGVYDIGLTKPVYIFQRLIENLMDVVKLSGVTPDLYIMTSEKNDQVTRDFLKEHSFFGYDAAHVFFFEQESAPAVDYEGQILLEEKDRLATSPNGNGGWYRSLLHSEAGAHFKASGTKWLNVFAVDNVLQRILDPVFLGATIEAGVNSGSKVIRKNAPDEGVGVLCLEDDHPTVIEYYELTDELKEAKDENGDPAYNFGVILNYLFKIEELNRVVDISLPFHRVEKKIPCLDEKGEKLSPDKPNGHKFELLVLDLVSAMHTCLPYEVVREKEFAPIKNKTGKDSVESARALLQQNGITL